MRHPPPEDRRGHGRARALQVRRTPVSLWLQPELARHTLDPQYIDALDLLEVRLEEIVAEYANRAVAMGIDADDARRGATNFLVHAALMLQRRYAPESLRAMVIAHAIEDPLLAGFRSDLAETAIRHASFLSRWKRRLKRWFTI